MVNNFFFFFLGLVHYLLTTGFRRLNKTIINKFENRVSERNGDRQDLEEGPVGSGVMLSG